ncbi:MAG: pro-sigmaK processing inhibitor BofA family protein [Tepidanaerobacteraceae bacterium]|jgi:inhibitor of the pro-sigma K processing machinery
MQIDFAAVIAYAFGLVLLYVLARLLILPLRLALKLIYNAVIGGIALVILNFFGGYFGLHIAVNPITALLVGFLGVPGIIMLILIKYILTGL